MAKKNKTAGKSAGAVHKSGGQTLKLGAALFIPLVLVLGVIPLIVHLNLIALPEEIRPFWTQNSAADFFSYYKSRALLLVAIYMIGVFGYYKTQGLKEEPEQNKSLRLYFVATAVFALFALLSTIFSKTIGCPFSPNSVVFKVCFLAVFFDSIAQINQYIFTFR